ncbi:GntR family transcriptional regulator [bacterium]|nr:MAG: GntR family transcriptional regulator [bacterium]
MSSLRVDPSSPVPIFRQIAEALRAAVAAGVYRPGELVPSVRQQALALLVNPNTVQRAYDELERDGLLVSRKGIGMAVADGAARSAARDAATDAQSALAAAIEAALSAGLTRDAIDARYAAAWRSVEPKRRGK